MRIKSQLLFMNLNKNKHTEIKYLANKDITITKRFLEHFTSAMINLLLTFSWICAAILENNAAEFFQ